MRLKGRKEIMSYLRSSWRNRDAWRMVRERYGDLIHCEPGTGHVWVLSEDLDAADRERCVTMSEFLKRGGGVGGAVGGYPRECQRLIKRMFKAGARGPG